MLRRQILSAFGRWLQPDDDADSTRLERRVPRERCYIGSIVKNIDVRSLSRPRHIVVLALTAWTMVFVTAGAMPGSGPTADHPAHVLSSVLSAEFAEVIDHSHLQEGSSLAAPDVLSATRLPRVVNALGAMGLVIVALAAMAGPVWSRAVAVRGPPARVPFLFAGRRLLETLCVSRR